MTDIYRSIKPLPFDNHGWFHEGNLFSLIVQLQPQTIVEVGAWLGCSTRFLAHTAKQFVAGVKVFAVDTWYGSPQEEVHQKDPRVVNHTLFHQFLSNVIHAQLQENVVPVRMRSDEAARALNVEPDLVYIDASHDEESVYKDIIMWYSKLRKGGVLCGDDLDWEGVKRAVGRCGNELAIKNIDTDGRFWQFSPKP
jgi:predicted O-methyltransferase YrrM